MTDIVFIDPVGTGYSRAAKSDLKKKFLGLEGDIESVGEFIRLYLTRSQRWNSPLFLVGESYGTTRAAGLSGHLIDHGIALNGVMLISTVLNFQTISFTTGNDLPYILFLPSYTATAFYHKKLAPELETDLQPTLREAERFAAGEYADALAKGDSLDPITRDNIAAKLSRYTGISKDYLLRANLRLEIQPFTKELLRDRRRTVGRLDSRIEGTDSEQNAQRPDFDPSLSAIRPPYTAGFNQYIRSELGYSSDLTYYLLGGGVSSWDWGSQNSFADTSTALRSAFEKNPHMKLFVGSGYFDLATPYFAAQYTLNHMGLPEYAHKATTQQYYRAGHMFYTHSESLHKLKTDAVAFMRSALAP
jgi:carboxypeptidase C (cathepsin A)